MSINVQEFTKPEELGTQLPNDLWKIIVSKLSFSDQVRFYAVCKNWMSLYNYIKTPAKIVPWIIRCYNGCDSTNNRICELYEPLASPSLPPPMFWYHSSSTNVVPKPSVVHIIDFRDYGIIPHCWQCIETSFKHGWLFFVIRELCGTRTSFLLFSPFTNKVITLPPTSVFYKTKYSGRLLHAFSADPSSPDCVFLVLHELGKKITIKTLGQGDKEWTSREFERSCRSPCETSDVLVYVQGIFYFVHRNAQVESYNIANGEWRNECPFISDDLIRSHCRYLTPLYRAFELNGELMVIYHVPDKQSLFVTRFDRSNNIWVPVKSLADKTLFLSGNSFNISAVGEETTNSGLLPNTVYSHDNFRCNVYSLESDKLIKSETVSGCINWYAFRDFFDEFLCEPPEQLVKQQKHGWDSFKNWIPEYTLLPVATKPGDQSIEDDELDN